MSTAKQLFAPCVKKNNLRNHPSKDLFSVMPSHGTGDRRQNLLCGMAHSLDQTDLAILDLLQQNARVSAKNVARKLGIPSPRVSERMKLLKDHGYIQQFVTLLDHRLIGKPLLVFVFVRLKAHEHYAIYHFAHQAASLEEVMEVHHLAGAYDFLLKIAASGLQDYRKFLLQRLWTISEIKVCNSVFMVNQIK